MNRMFRGFGLYVLCFCVSAPLWLGCGPQITKQCAKNADCVTPNVCVFKADGSSTCLPDSPGLVCKADAECQKTELCLNGRCQTVPGCICRANTDCGAGEKCVGCKCFKDGTGGACQTDSACGAQAQCINGKCVPKPSCRIDSECNLDEVCLQGVCQPGTSCKADAECGPNKVCQRGRCARKPLVGCQSELDCAAPAPYCQAATGKCVACRQDSECPVGQSCNNGTCEVQPCGCKSDADCPPSSVCKECRCVPVGGKGKAGFLCSQAEDCAEGHLCLRTGDGTSYCFQDCSTNPRICAANGGDRGTCLEVSRDQQGNPISLCLNVLKDGEKCANTGKTQAICDTRQELSCRADTQTCGGKGAVVRKNVGDSCDGQAVICDSALKLFCDPQTQTCQIASSTAKESQLCDPTNQQGGGAIPCEDGFTCIQFDQTGNNRCMKICDPKTPNSCAHNKGLQCLPLLSNGQGLCLNNCQTAADCTFKDYICRSLQGNNKICFPPSPSGPVPFGGACSSPVATKGCNTDPNKGGDPNFFCLAVSSGQPGFCSRECTNDDKCPGYTNKAGDKLTATCIEIDQQGGKACLFFCNQPGQQCPDGLTCQDVGEDVCLAP